MLFKYFEVLRLQSYVNPEDNLDHLYDQNKISNVNSENKFFKKIKKIKRDMSEIYTWGTT